MSESLSDLQDLSLGSLPAKEGPHTEHRGGQGRGEACYVELCKNAAKAPYVYFGRHCWDVSSLSEDFGCSVEPALNVERKLILWHVFLKDR